VARVVYDDDAPTIGGDTTHVFFELGDHLGSTSVVLDKVTGELVERATVQAYGGAESDYRPGRWKEFREDYRFTGKEEDVEVGLAYFGKRFYNPLLQRWGEWFPHCAGPSCGAPDPHWWRRQGEGHRVLPPVAERQGSQVDDVFAGVGLPA
jgi:RHS repeat-associated protein